MSDFIVTFVGLPSSGKSSIINSLVFKRILQSGVCRTTIEHKLIDEDVTDDNGNTFRVIDLPGICDSEDNNDNQNNFTELTYAHITNSNLIIWVSDVNKAFITTHEVDEYNKLKKHIKDIEDQTGTIYHIAIMLSKCDKNIMGDKKVILKCQKSNNEEIDDSDEDTNIDDLIDKVKQKFPQEDIMIFNAYGRSFYHDRSSEILKKFIKKMGIPNNSNISFDITKYIKNNKEDQVRAYEIKFNDQFLRYIDGKIDINKLLESSKNVSDDYKLSHLVNVCTEFIDKETYNTPSYNYHLYLYIMMEKSKYCEIDIIHKVLIFYHIKIYDSRKLNKIDNYYKDYDDKSLCEIFMHSFLIINDQEYFYNLILFTKHIKDINVAIRFIKEINQINNRDQFNFKSNFNKMLINNDVEIIKRFIDIMLRVIIESSGIPNYHSIDIPKELSLVDKFDYYIIAIDNMSENENYILHNKLQIMKNLMSSKVISCDFSLLSKLTITGINSIRILNNYRYKNCVNRIWTRIYSNIQIDYDGDFNQFVPISLVELIYNDEE
jgi:GTPase Era involved in 16S rRNA processing